MKDQSKYKIPLTKFFLSYRWLGLWVFWGVFPLQVFGQIHVLQQVISPFSVEGLDGRAMEQPFLGGWNAPQIQLLDLDKDGDMDLFLQAINGQISFFENRGTKNAPTWVLTLNHWMSKTPLQNSTWFRFADVNKDGNPELFVEKPSNMVQMWRGTWRKNGLHDLVLVADTLKDTSNLPVFSELGAVPQFADLDCDGDLDYVASKQDGTISHYRLVGLDGLDRPRYEKMTDVFANLSIVGNFCTTGVGLEKTAARQHGAATMSFHDENGDGKPEILWSDTFIGGVLSLENTGTCSIYQFKAPSSVSQFPSFLLPLGLQSSGLNQSEFADLDDDGDDDLLVGVLGGFCPDINADAIQNLHFYENTGTKAAPRYTRRSRQALPSLDFGKRSTPSFADLDRDGDFDLIVGNEDANGGTNFGSLAFLENIGTKTAPVFRLKDLNFLNILQAYNLAPAFGDLDGDGDLDLLLGQQNGRIRFYRQESALRFIEVSRAFANIAVGTNSAPALADLDQDQDLDLIVGNAVGRLAFYRNTGTNLDPNFVLETDFWQGLDVGDFSKPAFYDWNWDGKPDLLVGSERDGVKVLLNKSTTAQLYFDMQASPQLSEASTTALFFQVRHLAPALADLNGDGRVEVYAGTDGGGLLAFKPFGQTLNEVLEEDIVNKEVSLSLYPNPATNQLKLQIGLAQAKVVKIRVWDILGRARGQDQELGLSAGLSTYSFDLEGWQSGWYFVQVWADETALTKAVLVQKTP